MFQLNNFNHITSQTNKQTSTAMSTCPSETVLSTDTFLFFNFIQMAVGIRKVEQKNSHSTLSVTSILLLCVISYVYKGCMSLTCRSQWPRGLRRRSSAARLLRLWVRIPPAAWMFVCCECCVLSGRGLCDGSTTRPEKSYRLWRVVVCDQETSKTRRLNPASGL